jgi:hypothetical protein
MAHHFKYGLFRFALATLLLFAQQEALTHQAGHILDHTALHSQQQDRGGSKDLHSSLCDFHAAFAGVLGAVNSAMVAPCVVSQQFERDVAPEPPVFSALSLIRGARDPPCFHPVLI